MDRRWVILGGGLLSFLGGNINVMMLGFFHVPVSHMSGAFSHLSMVTGAGIDLANMGFSLGIVAAFFVGTIISGALIGKETLLPGNRYSVALLLEAFLLLLAYGMVRNNQLYGVSLAGAACGIQNGMATTYLGLNIRTTHVTGVVTDLGLAVGHLLRGHPLNPGKGLLLIVILAGFFLGGTAAAILFLKWGKGMMIFPALMAFGIAMGYLVFRKKGWI